MMKTIAFFFLWLSSFSCFAGSGTPFCATKPNHEKMIIAYLGADSSWRLQNTDLNQLKEQLAHVSLVNYSFIRLGQDGNGNTILNPTAQDIENIQTLRELKPDLPIMIAVGGWGEREGFKPFLEDETKMKIFVKSVKNMLTKYHLDGIDVDWENELLASEQEQAGVTKLLQYLHENISTEGYCLSNAVPGTAAYWQQYPSANLWQSYVNWTTIMAYDNYGTFGPQAEHGAALYPSMRQENENYPYPSTSGHQAVQHYYDQGLESQKIILGVPFYCHSYYIQNATLDNSLLPGLSVPVVDPNINSQVSYRDAYNTYENKLFSYQDIGHDGEYQAVASYGIIPLENTSISRFMSCESPQSVKDKLAYVKGVNPLKSKDNRKVQLGGVSFWSLQQDLPYSDSASLLKAINRNITVDLK